MSFWYHVILKPSDVKFTSNQVSATFKNGRLLQDLLDDLLEERKLTKEVPLLEVVWYAERWEWYTLDNRILWVFRQLERAGKISYINMRRIELVIKIEELPKKLYDKAEVVDKNVEEPTMNRLTSLKPGKQGKDVRLLSKKFKRLYLNSVKKSKGVKKEGLVLRPLVKRSEGDKTANSVSVDVVACGDEKEEPSSTECIISPMASLLEETLITDTENMLSQNQGVKTEAASVIPSIIEEEDLLDGGKDTLVESDEEHMGVKSEIKLQETLEGESMVGKYKDETNAAISSVIIGDKAFHEKGDFEAIVKEEPVEESKGTAQEDDFLSVYLSRSPSVCSLISEDRGVEDWGRKEKNDIESENSCEQLNEEEWIEIESIQDTDQEPSQEIVNERDNEIFQEANNDRPVAPSTENYDKKGPVSAWLEGRKKFCNRYAKNSKFLEYVADNIEPSRPRRKSLSESLISLDSAFSNASALSFSSLTKGERNINNLLSGFSGYGNFDKYNAEYLSKLRAERQAAKRRLKPYDVSNSRQQMTSSRASSFKDEEDWDRVSRRNSTQSLILKKETVTRRTYSDTYRCRSSRNIDVREKRFQRCTKYWYEHDTVRYAHDPIRYDRRNRRYSDSDLGESLRTRKGCPARSEKHFPHRRTNSIQGSESKFSFENSSRFGGSNGSRKSLNLALKNSSGSKASLYETWQRRREEYMNIRYKESTSLVPYRAQMGLSSVLTDYTCGLCFKSFKTRTRREQHSEELMHWACITCGRFFSSHTALGQHIEEVGHRKD